MTDLLHMRDNYIQEFDAKIMELSEEQIVLDRTAFYPEGGGQVGDQGSLFNSDNRVRISNTVKLDGKIQHLVEGDHSFEVGSNITGALDWARRYECMRFHTAQHVLSRYLQIHYDAITVGNQITPGKSRADYSPLESFDAEMKSEVEMGVNQILAQNLEVRINFMARDVAIKYLEDKGYQIRYLEMVPKSVKEFRIITIGDYDYSSCAGTHVKNTQEIGGIRIGKSKNVGSGKRRIYFSLIEN
ncbi:MAG: alanyl-tRNA editing protein [Candidatus Thorarchaeota archaeon]